MQSQLHAEIVQGAGGCATPDVTSTLPSCCSIYINDNVLTFCARCESRGTGPDNRCMLLGDGDNGEDPWVRHDSWDATCRVRM